MTKYKQAIRSNRCLVESEVLPARNLVRNALRVGNTPYTSLPLWGDFPWKRVCVSETLFAEHEPAALKWHAREETRVVCASPINHGNKALGAGCRDNELICLVPPSETKGAVIERLTDHRLHVYTCRKA